MINDYTMKKLYIFLLLPFFIMFACSNDNNETEPTQDYTSFIFELPSTVSYDFPNCIAAYKKDNEFHTIAKLGTLSAIVPSKEITVTDESITEVYFFTDFGVMDAATDGNRFDAIYKLSKNKKNIFHIEANTRGIHVKKSDPTKYPQ